MYLKKNYTQNNAPNEANIEINGQNTPSSASNGLLVIGSHLSDVKIVKIKTAISEIDMRGIA